MGGKLPVAVGPLFVAALGLLALFSHPGVFLNDELAQLAGLHALAEGSVLVGAEQPAGYAPFLVGVRHWGIPDAGDPAAPMVGSPLVNLLALPVLAVLSSLATVTSTRVALAIVGGLLAHAGLRAAWGMSTTRALPRWPGWLVAGAFVPALAAEDLAAAPYLEIAAAHLVSMAAIAWAAALLADLLAPRIGWTGALLGAGTFLVASPAFFWAFSSKYHALAISLTAVALWTYRQGAASTPGLTFLAYAVAGLAVFNYLPMGGLLLLTLVLLSLPALHLGIQQLGARMGAAAAGLAVGLVPEAVFRWAVSASGSPQQFIVGVGNEARTGEPFAVQLVHSTSDTLLGYSVFADWQAAGAAIVRTLVWTDWLAIGQTFPMVVLAPWVLLAIATLALPTLRARLGAPVWAFAVVHVAVVFLVTGSALVGTKAGFDPRYASTVWPGFAVLAAPTFGRLASRPGFRSDFAWAGGMAVALLALGLLANRLAHRVGWTLTGTINNHDELLVPRLTGYVAAFAVAYAFAWPTASLAWRRAAAAVGLAVAAGLEILLQLGFSNRRTGSEAPFAAWPLEVLATLVRQALS